MTQEFNFLSEPERTDPYTLFRSLHNKPVFYDEQIDHWVVSSYDAIKEIFLDHDTFSAKNTLQPVFPPCPVATQVLVDGGWDMCPVLGNNDRPDHSRFRKNVQKAFLPRLVVALEPYIEEMVNNGVDRLLNSGQVDLLREVIADIPARTILKLTGFDDNDGELLELLKEGGKNRVLHIWGHLEQQQQVDNAEGLLRLYWRCRSIAEERTRSPKDDLTSRIAALEDEERPGQRVFSVNEVALLVFAFFTAGHETTASFIANAVLQLLRHPEQWRAICEDPALVDNAVEELLRFDSSVHGWRRKTTRDVELQGIKIPAESQILLLLGAANHDEQMFPSPEVLDVRRDNAAQHLSFGKGIHFCLGNKLARMQAKIFLKVLSARAPHLQLSEGFVPQYCPNVVFHSMQRLDVEVNSNDGIKQG